MTLKAIYDKQEEIPTPYVDLYEEKDGKFVISKIEGIKTEADVEKLKHTLNRERENTENIKKKYKVLGDEDPAEILVKLQRVKELELAAGGKLDEESISKIVESRIAQKTSPLELTIKQLAEAKETYEKENHSLKTILLTNDRNNLIRQVAAESKAHSTAIQDIEMAASVMFEQNEEKKWITKNNIEGVMPGLSPKEWMKEMQRLRPHWWPESLGGGSRGGLGGLGNGDNPFSKENYNLTKQIQLRATNPTLAAQLAKAAGVETGLGKPK